MRTHRYLQVLLLTLFSTVAAAAVALAQDSPAAAVAAWQVTRYDITANVGAVTGVADRALTARASIAARNVGQGAGRTFTVRISPNAEIKAASVGDATAQFTTRTEARTKLQQVTVTLPATIATGGAVNVSLDYRLPVADNSGLAAISTEGAQFLPLSYWYPTPNTQFSSRGADTAPVRLTVNSASGDAAVSSGQASGASFEQTLNAQPFFLTGKWETVEGAGDAKGIGAWLVAGASADERKRGEALIALAADARSFYAGLVGAAPETPFRLVAVRRGAGFDMSGTLLLDAAVFRRPKTDAGVAMLIAESVARMWIGGATGLQGDGAGAVREGLARYMATLFLEKQFGNAVAEAERMRIALAYAPVARRDGPLSQSTLFSPDYAVSAANKGAMAWRLVANAVGRDAFMSALRRELEANRGGKMSLSSLRAALGERSNESLQRLIAGVFDQPTDTDLMIGLPQQSAGEWVVALRNIGSIDAEVSVVATTESGERVLTKGTLPAKDFGQARFKTTARLARVELDPEKLYPQLDYSNDVAPRAPSNEESLAEIVSLFARQQYPQVEEKARALFRRTPQMQEARTWLGRALLEQNKLDEAEKEFRAALEWPLPAASALAWSHIGFGEIALRRRQAADAARRFDEAARIEADYASTLAARSARLRAEAAASAPPAIDDSARAFITQLDQAILSGRKATMETLIVPGELTTFIRGIVSNQPALWQTRVLRTEPLGAQRMAVDVAINSKVQEQDKSATAVFILSRAASGWRLADIQFFEERTN